jgi:hypothetical protein
MLNVSILIEEFVLAIKKLHHTLKSTINKLKHVEHTKINNKQTVKHVEHTKNEY